MSHTPNYDAKVKAILDATKPGERVCALTGEKWVMDEREIGWYRKLNVTPSPLAPRTRTCHVYAYSNGVQWWWNKHTENGKQLLTYVHPVTPYKIIPDLEWHARDFSDRGMVYDATRSVLDHIHQLLLTVPLPASRNLVQPENSVSMVSLGDQDSYFTTGSKSKRTLFATTAVEVEDSMLVYHSRFVTNSYSVVHSRNIHNSTYVRESNDCSNSTFLFDCRNCEFCYGATNQRNKNYLWMNEQLTQQEWEKRRAEIDFSCRSTFEEQFSLFHALMLQETVWPENFNEKVQGDTSGEYLHDCIGCRDCYFVEGAKNVERCSFTLNTLSENCYCCHGIVGAADSYQSLTIKNGQAIYFSSQIIDSRDVEYSLNCFSCEHCFGCVGIRNKKFHLFNKPYSEADYWKELDRVKCQMLEEGTYGSFFPISWTYIYPPESGLGLYLSLKQDEVDRIGAPMFDPNTNGAMGEAMNGQVALATSEIPDCIDVMPIKEWTGKLFQDTTVNRRFTFLKPELEYYREHHLFPPNTHFIARMKKLIRSAQANRFEMTTCQKCHKEIQVAVNAESPERKIYCRACYLSYLEKR